MKYDLIVIGSGPGGYPAALKAALLGMSVAVIEKEPAFGGTCLNVGCIPSKTLLYYTEIYSHTLFGAKKEPFDFEKLMRHKEEVVKSLGGSLRALFQQHKVVTIQGLATLTSAHTVRVNDQEIEATNIILATGSESIALPFLPFDEERVLSSTGMLSLKKVPSTLIVVGAGVIGVELASVYARLGTKVTMIELLPEICAGIDSDIGHALLRALKDQGIEILLSKKVLGAKKGPNSISIELEGNTLQAEAVLVSVGRRPASKSLQLDALGIETLPSGQVVVDGNFQTKVPSIFAIGDLITGPMLAHRASLEGEAVVEYIAGKDLSVEYMTIPNVIYTSPEAAMVGFTEDEIRKTGRKYKVAKAHLRGNPKAYLTGATNGLVKIIVDETTGVLLGMHILSPHASELICIGMLAIQQKMKAVDLARLPFPHPTVSEAIKEACMAIK